MYTAHFGLSELPFSISPDPRYLYLSQRYREALAHLIYGTQQAGGFIQLTGEVGTGKTTLTRALLEQLPDNVDVALLLNPKQSALEFLHSICDELRITYTARTTKAFVDGMNSYLLEAHSNQRHTVLLIDEAQNLTVDVLEQIRLLTNLETTQKKLLQIILVGQPELRVLLARKELRQLAQRITARYHLLPLTETETAQFIRHRLTVAGQSRMIFNNRALKLIFNISKGIPRLINVICDRSLLGAYAEGKHQIDVDTVKRAAQEVTGEICEPDNNQKTIYKYAIAASVVIFSFLTMYLTGIFSSESSEKVLSDASANPNTAIFQVLDTEKTNNIVLSDTRAANLINSATSTRKLPAVVTPKATYNKRLTNNVVRAADPRITSGLSELLNNTSIQTDKASAYAELFSIWSLNIKNVSSSGLACQQAARSGLSCWHNKGTWNNLRVVNRPAIIELIDSRSNHHSVVVTSLIDGVVNLSFAGKIFSFQTHEVDPFWYGNFVVLWRQPLEFDQDTIHPGVRGLAAQWLKQTLDRLDGIADTGRHDNLFDAELETRVKAFQRERYLDDDGVVGKQTMIHLNTALNDPSIPVLSSN